MLRHIHMPFAVHSDVLIKTLGKTGRVMEATRTGRYRVRVGGVLMVCREDELAEAATGDRRRKRRAPEPASPVSRPDAAPHVASIDLHGFTVEEALRKVEERLDLALREGVERLEIIHGRSSGRIKVAVHRLLRELTVVRSFEVSAKNPGVTNVYL